MSTQVARIGGQLLQANLLRELDDLKFDTDLLVVKRDNTLGIGTTTTPRNLTINGTMRTTSGGSDPDIVFGNSIKQPMGRYWNAARTLPELKRISPPWWARTGIPH